MRVVVIFAPMISNVTSRMYVHSTRLAIILLGRMDVPVMKVITKREQHVQMKMNAPLELTIANKNAQVRQ